MRHIPNRKNRRKNKQVVEAGNRQPKFLIKTVVIHIPHLPVFVVTAMAKELSQRFSNMEKARKAFSTKEELDTLTLEQLQTRTIKVRKTKVGQTYEDVAAMDPACTWFLSNYGDSKKDTHQEFVKFLTLHMEFMEDALNIQSDQGVPGTTAKSSAQEQEQGRWKQGNWETLKPSQFVRPRGSGGRRLVAGRDDREFSSGRTTRSREQHGGRPDPDRAPADPDAASHDPGRAAVSSSTKQGHLIKQVCEGLSTTWGSAVVTIEI